MWLTKRPHIMRDFAEEIGVFSGRRLVHQSMDHRASSGGPTNGVTFIVTPGGGMTDAVRATISSSEAGGTGKLFGCRKAINP